MDLYLYNYENGNVEEIFSWNPEAPQWWITGFNPDHIGKVDVNKQVMIGNVNFKSEGLYENFKIKTQSDLNLKDYVIFDNNTYTVWICWHAEGGAK